ncbi:MAG: hypothetical protein Q7S98_00625, partial [Deltaproteobacteria bacterium]|nr:hypothetical protein [Deltaproteobacteria bacterium]
MPAKSTNQVMIQTATKIAKSSKAKAIFILIDALDHVAIDEQPLKGCPFIPVTRRRPDETLESFPDELKGMLERTVH